MLRNKTRLNKSILAGMLVVGIAVLGFAQVGEAEQGAGCVFFVSPADGATVTSPVSFEFGVEGLEISPVPEEVDQPRDDIGHYHIGFNTECLPVGEELPQADPWVHFGDGSSTFESLLDPGEHTFAVQIGADEHRTLEGLCDTITITVE